MIFDVSTCTRVLHCAALPCARKSSEICGHADRMHLAYIEPATANQGILAFKNYLTLGYLTYTQI